MSSPLLSILTPAIWSRAYAAEALCLEIKEQCDDLDTDRVEHITLFDNRRRSVGLKRQACLDIALGEYIAFVDDDDAIRPDYIAKILSAIEVTRAHVITFDQHAIVNDEHAIINFDLTNPDEPFTGIPSLPSSPTLPIVRRNAWHVCVWKRALIADCLFPDTSYGEDLQWSLQARARARTHHHINAVLHEYHHSTALTAAPPPL